MQEKEHVLEVLRKTRNALHERDVIKLRSLSNATIHSASIYKDTDSIMLAVIIYSLSKIIESQNGSKIEKCGEFCKKASLFLEKALASLSANNTKEFSRNLEGIVKSINTLSRDLKDYVKDVFEKAKINKASKIYEHGISLGKTAELLGITMWDVANYAGAKGVVDIPSTKTQDVKKRIKLAMDFFK